jgi:hypothetical protein
MVITEKLDGTNAQIFIADDGEVIAGSRNRWITPLNDNFGFARWVFENEDALRALGPRHRLVLNDTMAFAHTSPVYVTVGGGPVRETEDIRFYRDWIERLIARTEKSTRFATEQRREEVLALFRKALAWYQ